MKMDTTEMHDLNIAWEYIYFNNNCETNFLNVYQKLISTEYSVNRR